LPMPPPPARPYQGQGFDSSKPVPLGLLHPATRTRLRPVSPNLDGCSELPMSLADNSTNCHLSNIRKHRRQLRSDWQGAESPGGAPEGQNSSPPAVPQAEQACSALDRRARLRKLAAGTPVPMVRRQQNHKAELESGKLELVAELRARLASSLPARYDTEFNLARWLTSADKVSRSKGNVDLAEKNLRHHLKFRQALNLNDEQVPTWDENPIYKHQLLPKGHFEWIASGHCFLWWVDYSTLDMSALLYTQKSTDVLIYHFWKYEQMLRMVNEREAATGQQCTVYAVIDLRQWPFNPLTLLFVNDGQMSYYANLFHYEHYPDLVQPINLINAPTWISLPYRLVKSTMPKDFGDRFRVLNHNYMATLLEELPLEVVPESMGGLNKERQCFETVPSKYPLPGSCEHRIEVKRLADEAHHFHVNARRRHLIPVECQPGWTLQWRFTTDSALMFGIFFKPAGEQKVPTKPTDLDKLEMVYPLLRFAAKFVPESGQLKCLNAGTYYLAFCNKSSWWSRRHIHLELHVESQGTVLKQSLDRSLTSEIYIMAFDGSNISAPVTAAENAALYAAVGIKCGSKQNTLSFWGNKETMNLNHLVLENIVSSPYYKNTLLPLKTHFEVIDEIYYNVEHLEPWEKGTRKTTGQTGMCGGVRGVGAGGVVSSAFCLLYKLFTLKLTRKQLTAILNHPDSCYIRGLGFMYIRFCLHPATFWSWYEPYFDDAEEIDPKAGGGDLMTIGEMVKSLLTKLDWYSTLFPRIPVPIQKEIDLKLRALSSQKANRPVAESEQPQWIERGLRHRSDHDGRSESVKSRSPGQISSPEDRERRYRASRRSHSRSSSRRSSSHRRRDRSHRQHSSRERRKHKHSSDHSRHHRKHKSHRHRHHHRHHRHRRESEREEKSQYSDDQNMAEGNWCLIESDPGIFTEMIHGFGCTGLQVEELVVLDESIEHLKPIHGFIFLFRWLKKEMRKEVDDSPQTYPDVYFSQQVIQNACASQALINLLLNCDHPDVDLGSTLKEFKDFTCDLDSASRGLCLTNSEKIRTVHNSFSRQQLFEIEDQQKLDEEDAFHFVTYVHVNDGVYELDGLRTAPLRLGTVASDGDWTEVAIKAIKEKIKNYGESEVRFNLMAVISDQKLKYEREMEKFAEAGNEAEVDRLTALIAAEDAKRERYAMEVARHRHNYVPFIVELLRILAEEEVLSRMLADAIHAQEDEIVAVTPTKSL
ncbi:Ubiquitin carboxyl-terminal hydrolase isozyme L5, partial [Trichinella pseudospiralis]